MELIECKDERSWVDKINLWLRSAITRYHAARLFLPAGETPKALYRDWQQNGAPFAEDLRLVQLDEIISGSKAGAFGLFFREYLGRYVEQLEFIKNADGFCDLAILGLGLNGHVAFHEPGLPVNFYSGCLTLNADTARRSQMNENDRVVTYGLDSILRSKAILLIVRGESKAKILQQILEPNCPLPAAQLLQHKNVTIVTDFKAIRS